MQGFKIFFEILDVANTKDVKLNKDERAYVYYFKVDGAAYNVAFEPDEIDYYEPITAYAVYLYGPNGYNVTNLGKGPTVYHHLLKAVKKFIKKIKPAALTFSGINDQQNIMYAKFYEKYLKQYFTRIEYDIYIRNDVLSKLQQTNPEAYQAIQNNIQNLEQSNFVEKWRQRKQENRQKTIQRNLKLRAGGVVAIDQQYFNPCYVQSVSGNTATVMAILNGNTLTTYQTPLSNIQPIEQYYQVAPTTQQIKLLHTLQNKNIPFTYL